MTIKIIITVLIFLFPSCVRIPEASVQLSEELAGMIRSAEKSHIAMLDQYISERKQRTNDFLDKIWIPRFLENYVHDSGILDSLSIEKNVKRKDTLLIDFTNAGIKVIKKRRDELFKAINEIEKALRDSITAHYNNMLIVNQALTAHLRSAAKVTETRDEILSHIYIDPKKIIPFDKLNDVFEKIQSYEGEMQDIKLIVDEAKTLLNRR